MSKQTFTIRQDGPRVLLIHEGQLVANLAPNAARELADALKNRAGLAEEIIERERLVVEEALVLRTGFPLSLIHNPHLRHEAEQTAAWDSNLRRYLPGGVRSEAHFGVLQLIQHQPTPAQAAKQRAYLRRKGQQRG